jgi:hypothetical protein
VLVDGFTRRCDVVATNVREEKREGRRPRDLARQLGLHPSVIYEAIAAGELGPVWRFGKEGRAIVIPEKSIRTWLRSKRVGGDEAIA